MKKDILRALRRLEATKEMVQKAYLEVEKTQRYWYGKSKPNTKILPVYSIFLRVQCLGPYIKIAVFLNSWLRKGITTPKFEIFLNPDGDEWINRILDENYKELRWSNSFFRNLVNENRGYYDGFERNGEYDHRYKVFANADATKTLKRLTDWYTQPKNPIDCLMNWQNKIREADIEAKERRETTPWDEDMSLIPETPKNFEKWLKKNCLNDYFIIYEYSKNGQKEGYCTRCEKMVPIVNPKHGKPCKCPRCKTKGTFKSSGKIRTLTTSGNAQLAQPVEDGIVVRKYSYSINYCDYMNPRTHLYEWQRILMFEDETIRVYNWDSYKNKYMRWVKQKYNYFDYAYYSATRLYPSNIKSLLKKSWLKQSAFPLWKELPCDLAKYLNIERQYPIIERLAKVGMFKLDKDILEHYRYTRLKAEDTVIDFGASELSKNLRIDKSRLHRLKNMQGGWSALEWLQREKQENTIWSDELIQRLDAEEIEPSQLNFVPSQMTFIKTANYLIKQCNLSCSSMEDTIRTWADYLNMAEKMKMNIDLEQIYKPKDLKLAHDKLVVYRSQQGIDKMVKDLEKKWPKVDKQLPKLKKFEFAAGDYVITVPESIKDIVTEGIVLSHCVHTSDYYYDRIERDESYLFFLRHSKCPDIPWYTLEVEPGGNIRQKRTTGDKQNEDFKKAIPFLKKWQKYFLKKLTPEEKELGVVADHLRVENYKQLRKDQKKVWHGALAGQLLADVLEADFMKAM